jgi:hypothetical protein
LSYDDADMTPRQQDLWKAAKTYGPWVLMAALTFGVSVKWPGDRLAEVEERTTALEGAVREVARVMDAYALSQCLQEKNAIARAYLECGRREQQAGIRR